MTTREANSPAHAAATNADAAAKSPATASPRAAAEATEAAEADAPVAVTVVDCRRLHDNDYLFTLANGEFWRQAGGSTLRLGDCKFEATISKDFFGHKMTFDLNGRTVRVKRVQ